MLLDHGMHCVGCAVAPFETMARSVIYGVSLEQLIVELRDDRASEERGDDMNSATTATLPCHPLRSIAGNRRIGRCRATWRAFETSNVEMPGLVLTLPQAARLWGLSESRSALLLSMLVEAGFLICDKKTVYRRRLDRSERRKGETRPAVSTQEIVVDARHRQ